VMDRSAAVSAASWRSHPAAVLSDRNGSSPDILCIHFSKFWGVPKKISPQLVEVGKSKNTSIFWNVFKMFILYLDFRTFFHSEKRSPQVVEVGKSKNIPLNWKKWFLAYYL
jgi:hypothetical protein